MDYKAIESGKDYLAHHGVKGMKWGIRHDPERVGRAKKAVADIGKTVVRGLRRKTKAAYKKAKRVAYNSRQRKIEKAIASGNSDRINKLFSKMNDQQASRAIIRMNQREAILRSRVEDGKRSLKNVDMQRKIDTLNLRNQYKQAKHPTLSKGKSNVVDNATKVFGNKLGTAMAETTIAEIKKAASKPKNVSEPPFNTSNAVDVEYKVLHSDMLVDSGKNYLQHGYKYLKKIQIGNHVRYFYTPEQLKAYYEADKKAAQVSRDVANAKIAARTKLMNIGESQETQDANNNIAGALQLYNYGRAAIQPHVRTVKLAGRSVLGSKNKKTLKKRARDSLLKKRGMMTIGKLIKKLGG